MGKCITNIDLRLHGYNNSDFPIEKIPVDTYEFCEYSERVFTIEGTILVLAIYATSLLIVDDK